MTHIWGTFNVWGHSVLLCAMACNLKTTGHRVQWTEFERVTDASNAYMEYLWPCSVRLRSCWLIHCTFLRVVYSPKKGWSSSEMDWRFRLAVMERIWHTFDLIVTYVILHLMHLSQIGIIKYLCNSFTCHTYCCCQAYGKVHRPLIQRPPPFTDRLVCALHFLCGQTYM